MTTLSEATRCPNPLCNGSFFIDHPAGPLTCQHHVHCAFLTAEDSRKVADLDLPTGTLRPATPTELVLWSAATGSPTPIAPRAAFVRVKRVTRSVVRRDIELWNLTTDGRPLSRITDTN